MGFQLSPGINVSESDLTTIVPAVGTTVGAIAGPFRWGPANKPMLIDSELTLVSTFGKPDNATANTWFTASNFLGYANALQTVRVVRETGTGMHKNATADGTGILITNEDSYLASYAGGQGAVGMFAAKYPGDLGNSLAVSMADADSFNTWEYKDNFDGAPSTSTMIEASGGSNDEIHVVVIDTLGYWTGVLGTVLERFAYLSKSVAAKYEDGATMYYPEVLNRKSKYIWWMDHPTSVEIGIAGTPNWGSDVKSTDFDTMSQKLTLQDVTGTFAIGETVVDAAAVTISAPTSGTTATASITIDGNGVITAVTLTNPGSGYLTAPTVTITTGPGTGATFLAVLGTGSNSDKVDHINIVTGGTGYQTVSGKVLSFVSSVLTIAPLTGEFDTSGSVGGHAKVTGLTSGATGTVHTKVGGAITKALTGGVDGNANLAEGDYIQGYDKFRSGEDIDVSLILGADATATIAIYLINSIAEYRKDCVAFLSPPKVTVVDNAGDEATDIVAFRNLLPSTSYAVMDSGWKYQYDKYYDIYRWVPLNGDVAGLCVRTDNERDPWWSPAGYNRGHIQNVVRLAWNPRKAYRDVLYQAGINPVMSEPGQGTLLFGDKTMLSKPSAFDRINVRRLFIVLEKAISTASKFTLFEFNDQFTRAQFVNMVEPYLRDVKGRRGIYDFRVVCDTTNNTADVIDSNSFVGDIYVKPARSINFIQLNFVAVRSGVDFSEIVGKF